MHPPPAMPTKVSFEAWKIEMGLGTYQVWPRQDLVPVLALMAPPQATEHDSNSQ